MEKDRDQQKPLHIPAATSLGPGEEKAATSPGKAGEKEDRKHVRVRSLSEGDAVGLGKGEGGGDKKVIVLAEEKESMNKKKGEESISHDFKKGKKDARKDT